MLRWLWLSAGVILLDQASKLAALAWLTPHQPRPVLPGLHFTLLFNEGAAFSFLSTAGGWQRWLFTALALLVAALLIHWLRELPRNAHVNAAALALILGGALGNVVDRLRLGHVVDFIDAWYPASHGCLPLFSPQHAAGQLTCHWPAFNLADSAITLGAVLLIGHTLLDTFRTRPGDCR